MEDADGRLFISEGSLPTIGKKEKQPTSMKDEEWEILDRKALGTIRLVPGSIDGFQYFKRKDNEDLMNALDKLYEKPSASNKVFLMK
jgi:hypothetical protein